MERCHGKTKAGERCKRSAREDSRFCSIHVEQGDETPEAGGSQGKSGWDHDLFDAAIALAVVGFALGGAFVFRRLFKFP